MWGVSLNLYWFNALTANSPHIFANLVNDIATNCVLVFKSHK